VVYDDPRVAVAPGVLRWTARAAQAKAKHKAWRNDVKSFVGDLSADEADAGGLHHAEKRVLVVCAQPALAPQQRIQQRACEAPTEPVQRLVDGTHAGEDGTYRLQRPGLVHDKVTVEQVLPMKDHAGIVQELGEHLCNVHARTGAQIREVAVG